MEHQTDDRSSGGTGGSPVARPQASRLCHQQAEPSVVVPCPFCQATDSELISPFGSQLLTDQRRCRACGSYFEAVRDDR